MRNFIRLGLLALALLAGTPAQADKDYLSDVGQVNFPNSGAEKAQRHFLRGLAQLHNFEYGDAAWNFQQAQAADPGFAMACWGEAMTHNHPIWMEQDRDAALEILSRLGATAEERASKAGSDRERDYLAAIETLYGAGEKFDRDYAYRDAMAALAEKYPDDVEAQAFHALAIMGTAHTGRDVPKYMQAGAIANDLVFANPDHPGAAHYMIHATDDPEHAFLGLKAARAYSKIAPNAAHAQHMTSHIFLALGMWDETVLANQNAARVDREARQRQGQEARACGHYNYWLIYGYSQQDDMEAATKGMMACHEQAMSTPPEETNEAGFDAGRNLHRNAVTIWVRYLIDAEGWNSDLLDFPNPGAYEVGATYLYDFMQALAAGRRGDLGRAKSGLAAMRKGIDAVIPGFDPEQIPADEMPWKTRLRMQVLQIEGLIAILEDDQARGLELLRHSVALEAAAPYEFGPPVVDKPAHELLADMLLETGHVEEAIRVYRTSLLRTRGRLQSEKGLERALAAASSSSD